MEVSNCPPEQCFGFSSQDAVRVRVKPKLLVMVALSLWACAPGRLHGQNKEVSANYSLIVYNPAKSIAESRNLNGGGGSIGYNLGDYLTLKAEFEATSSTTFTFHLQATPNSQSGTFNTKGDMFTYLAGPQINIPGNRRRFFAEALFGGAYTNAYANLFKAADVTGLKATNNGFAMAIGGGIDFVVAKHIAIRPIQFDYFLTRYEWKPLGINNQSNFRYQAGMVFAFGG